MRFQAVAIGLFLVMAHAACDSALGQIESRRSRRARQSQLNPNHERAKNEADASYRRGEYRRAEELTTNVLLENPRDDVALYLRASARVERGLRRRDSKLIRQGIGDAREAIRLNRMEPMYFMPYLYGMRSLSAVENREDHAELAVQVAGQALASRQLGSSDRANLYYQRGNAHKQLEQFEAAVSDFEEAVRLESSHLGAHIALAETHGVAGQEAKARTAYDVAVETFASNPLVYNNRGTFLQDHGKLSEAIQDFTRALELEPNYYFAYTNRGAALLEMGDAEAAATDFSASLKANARQPTVYHMRSIAKLAQGDLQGALRDQLQVLELIPQYAPAHADLGFVRFFAEDYRNAVNSFTRALELDADLRHVHPWRYWALKRSGRDAQAGEALSSALREEDPDWVDHVLGYVAGNLDETALLDAVHESDEVARSKQLCEAHFFIGLKREQQGRLEDAQRHFQQAVQTEASDLSAYRGAQLALKRIVSAGGESSGL